MKFTLENGISLKRLFYTNNIGKIYTNKTEKQNLRQNMSNVTNKIQIYVQNNKFHFLQIQ